MSKNDYFCKCTLKDGKYECALWYDDLSKKPETWNKIKTFGPCTDEKKLDQEIKSFIFEHKIKHSKD